MLQSTTSSSVRIGLVELSRKVQNSASPNIDEHFSHGCVCKKCFAEVERFIVLSGKLTELENTISSKIREGLVSFGHCGSQECERGAKRQSQHDACTSTPKRMRIGCNSSSSTSDPVVVS